MKTKVLVLILFLAVVGLLLHFLPTQAEAQKEMARMEAELAAAQERSDCLDELCALLAEEKLGYANESFRVDRSVVVLKNGGEPEKLKLTAHWEGGGNVFVDCSSDAAELSFDETDWDRYTTMTLTPSHPGVTVARFSSDAAKATFAVFILVEE